MFIFFFGPRGFLCLTFPEAFRDKMSPVSGRKMFTSRIMKKTQENSWPGWKCCRNVWLASELVGFWCDTWGSKEQKEVAWVVPQKHNKKGPYYVRRLTAWGVTENNWISDFWDWKAALVWDTSFTSCSMSFSKRYISSWCWLWRSHSVFNPSYLEIPTVLCFFLELSFALKAASQVAKHWKYWQEMTLLC